MLGTESFGHGESLKRTAMIDAFFMTLIWKTFPASSIYQDESTRNQMCTHSISHDVRSWWHRIIGKALMWMDKFDVLRVTWKAH